LEDRANPRVIETNISTNRPVRTVRTKSLHGHGAT